MDSPQVPEPPPPSLPPPGWHDDPDDSTSLRYWDGTQWTDQRSPKPVDSTAKSQTIDLKDWPPLRLAAVAGAVAVIIGSFGPWATASALFTTVTRNGMDGDGKITAGAGVILVILIFTRQYLGATIVAAINGAIVAYEWLDVNDVVSEINDDADIPGIASVGWGLYLLVGGAVIAFVASVSLLPGKRAERKGEPEPATTLDGENPT